MSLLDDSEPRRGDLWQNDSMIALNRKNAVFAGQDGVAENYACIASLIETCKLDAVDPQAYISDALIGSSNLRPLASYGEAGSTLLIVNDPDPVTHCIFCSST